MNNDNIKKKNDFTIFSEQSINSTNKIDNQVRNVPGFKIDYENR